jgi:hypothetical protein
MLEPLDFKLTLTEEFEKARLTKSLDKLSHKELLSISQSLVDIYFTQKTVIKQLAQKVMGL